MNLKTERAIDRSRWLAALHVKGNADEVLWGRMEEAEALLFEAAVPRTTYRIMQRADVQTCGFSIEKHLEGCHKVIILAATLGAGVDQLLRRMQIADMALAVIIDSGASVLIEQVCDALEEELRQKLSSGNARQMSATGQTGAAAQTDTGASAEYMTSRFSPGYGDYPITEQSRIIRYLDAQRQIGLHITADSLMIPRKSITALIGVADHPVTGKLATCTECVLRDKCTLRKEGKYCGSRF